MNLAGQVGIVLLRRLENNLEIKKINTSTTALAQWHARLRTNLGAICEFVGSKVNLAKGSFSY